MARWLRLVAAAALVGLASGTSADDLGDEICKNFQDYDDSYPYEEYKTEEVAAVWRECYADPAVPAACDCVEDGCCDFDANFELDCTGSCRDKVLDAIHNRCWYRYDIDDEPPKEEQCESGSCTPALYVYREGIDKGRQECLAPQWGFIFLLIFAAIFGAIIMLAIVGYVAKTTMERVQRRKID